MSDEGAGSPPPIVFPSRPDERRGDAHVGQVRLGRSGLSISRLGLGMMSYGAAAAGGWTLDEAGAEPIVRAALECGVTFFDTADTYGDGASEIVTGRLLAKLARREDVVVGTKVFFPMSNRPSARGLSRKHILSAVDASLERLGMDHIDLYQVHRWDDQAPIEETMGALEDVVRAGKVRYLGASTMYAWQFARAQEVAHRSGWTSFTSMQNRYNLLYREEEREMIPLCMEEGVGVLPYSPLAGGALAGTRSRRGERVTPRARSLPENDDLYGRPVDFDVIDRVHAVARELGTTPAAVGLAWLLARPGVTAPIIGATRIEHVYAAVAATELVLDGEQTSRLEELYKPRAWVG